MPRLLALSLVALLAACGGGSSGGGDGGGTPDTGTPDTGTPDTGTPAGGTPDTGTPGTGGTNSLAVAGSLAFTPGGQVGVTSTASACTIRGTSSSASVVAVVATSGALACGGIAAKTPSSSILFVSVTRERVGQAAAAIVPGTYSITAPASADEPRAAVTVLKRDASGEVDRASSAPGTAISGSVELTSVGATLAGTVDATLLDGGRVTGSFSVPACTTPTPAEVCLVAGGSPPPTSQFPTGTP